ncbi:MAG: hypothetical protein M3112_09335 [Actinomycetia bacterium]|nr:hypothetical protein [Actinomycetes bacterium]
MQHDSQSSSFRTGSHTTIVLILASGDYPSTLWEVADWARDNTERDE